MAGRLQGKTCLVTGAAQGIGAAVARAMASEGARVAVTDVDENLADQTASTIRRETGGESCAWRLDVEYDDSFPEVVALVTEHWGPADVLVNNAGRNVMYPPLEMPADAWDHCLNLNLKSMWRGARAVLPGMIERGGGSIINVASTHAFQIIPGCFPYPVAKHGVIGLTRALGVEYARYGVRVNALAPGYIETRACLDAWAQAADPAEARSKTESLIPAGRIGQPEEVAMTAVFLASDEARFIVATCIEIDGGRMALHHE